MAETPRDDDTAHHPELVHWTVVVLVVADPPCLLIRDVATADLKAFRLPDDFESDGQDPNDSINTSTTAAPAGAETYS